MDQMSEGKLLDQIEVDVESASMEQLDAWAEIAAEKGMPVKVSLEQIQKQKAKDEAEAKKYQQEKGIVMIKWDYYWKLPKI